MVLYTTFIKIFKHFEIFFGNTQIFIKYFTGKKFLSLNGKDFLSSERLYKEKKMK